MSRIMKGIVALVAVWIIAAPQMVNAEVELKSKAVEIKLTGREHTQFNTSSVEGALGSEFLIRRARITAEVKLNDIVSGKIQPDFGGGKLSLKDAYTKLTFSPRFKLITGQFKRPFDIFELTSSTQILVVERTGKVRGASGFTSLSSLTEGLHYADRDIGVMAAVSSANKGFALAAAVTNGDGANKVPSKLKSSAYAVSQKQYSARATFKPLADRHMKLSAGFTALPVAQIQPAGLSTAVNADLDVEYATAFEFSGELGSFKQNGLHVQAGGIFGDNWKADRLARPSFMAVQGIVSVKRPLAENRVFTAFEPVVRVSYADPNTDTDDDAGLLITPGLQLFFVGRNKIALNVDVFMPQDSDRDTEYSVKAQSSLYF